tara:strand:+ start:1694 stop:2356 length:663 start_codon:yes stop_codon:yes gene_type:complete
MTVGITVTSDIKALSKWLTHTQRIALPSAIRNALNDTAKDTWEYMRRTLPRHIDNPTPYTLKNLQYEKTDKNRLEAKVGFASSTFGKPRGIGSAHYMKLLIDGGIRTPRRTSIAVPTKVYKTDKFGNIGKPGKIKSLLNKKNHFQDTLNGKAGIFKTSGRGKNKKTEMIIAYEKTTIYRPQFNFPVITKQVVNRVFKPTFEKQLNEVLRKKNLHGIKGWI